MQVAPARGRGLKEGMEGETHHLPLLRGLVHAWHHLVMEKQKQRLVRHFLLILKLWFSARSWAIWAAPPLPSAAARPSLLGDRGIYTASRRRVLEWTHPRLPSFPARRESLTATGTKPNPQRPSPDPGLGAKKQLPVPSTRASSQLGGHRVPPLRWTAGAPFDIAGVQVILLGWRWGGTVLISKKLPRPPLC